MLKGVVIGMVLMAILVTGVLIFMSYVGLLGGPMSTY